MGSRSRFQESMPNHTPMGYDRGMEASTKTGLAVAAGTVLAGVYFWDSERGISREDNCTYLAPWTTDVAAWAAGAALIFIGHRNGSPTTSLIGAAIATLHVAQFASHKVINRPPKQIIVEALGSDFREEEKTYSDVANRALLAQEWLG